MQRVVIHHKNKMLLALGVHSTTRDHQYTLALAPFNSHVHVQVGNELEIVILDGAKHLADAARTLHRYLLRNRFRVARPSMLRQTVPRDFDGQVWRQLSQVRLVNKGSYAHIVQVCDLGKLRAHIDIFAPINRKRIKSAIDCRLHCGSRDLVFKHCNLRTRLLLSQLRTLYINLSLRRERGFLPFECLDSSLRLFNTDLILIEVRLHCGLLGNQFLQCLSVPLQICQIDSCLLQAAFCLRYLSRRTSSARNTELLLSRQQVAASFVERQLLGARIQDENHLALANRLTRHDVDALDGGGVLRYSQKGLDRFNFAVAGDGCGNVLTFDLRDLYFRSLVTISKHEHHGDQNGCAGYPRNPSFFGRHRGCSLRRQKRAPPKIRRIVTEALADCLRRSLTVVTDCHLTVSPNKDARLEISGCKSCSSSARNGCSAPESVPSFASSASRLSAWRQTQTSARRWRSANRPQLWSSTATQELLPTRRCSSSSNASRPS